MNAHNMKDQKPLKKEVYQRADKLLRGIQEIYNSAIHEQSK